MWQTKTKDYQGNGSLLQPDEKSKQDSSQLQAEPENNSKVKIKLNTDAKKTNVTAVKVNEQELPRNRYSETYKWYNQFESGRLSLLLKIQYTKNIRLNRKGTAYDS